MAPPSRSPSMPLSGLPPTEFVDRLRERGVAQLGAMRLSDAAFTSDAAYEIDRLRSLLHWYAAHVLDSEGVTFLRNVVEFGHPDLSAEDLADLKAADEGAAREAAAG